MTPAVASTAPATCIIMKGPLRHHSQQQLSQQQSRQLVFNDSGGKAVKATSSFGGGKKEKNFQNVSTVEKGKVYRLDTIIALPTEKTVMTPTTFLFSFFFHKINIVRLCV
jgi:hypothetical protein